MFRKGITWLSIKLFSSFDKLLWTILQNRICCTFQDTWYLTSFHILLWDQGSSTGQANNLWIPYLVSLRHYCYNIFMPRIFNTNKTMLWAHFSSFVILRIGHSQKNKFIAYISSRQQWWSNNPLPKGRKFIFVPEMIQLI